MLSQWALTQKKSRHWPLPKKLNIWKAIEEIKPLLVGISYWKPKSNRSTRGSSRFSIQIWGRIGSVSSRKCHNNTHSGWQNSSLSVWHRLLPTRPPMGFSRGCKWQDRERSRSSIVTLLQLRPNDWQIRVNNTQFPANYWDCHSASIGVIHLHYVTAWAKCSGVSEKLVHHHLIDMEPV